ncbi:MAG: alkaline shock response membrane anchor protein AmaP, partial [Pauljensenia sp.]
MRTPVPAIVYRPTRSAPATLLALLLLIVGGLGTWLTAYRFLTGAWPQRAVATLDAVGTVSFSSIAALIAAGIAAVCGLLMLVAALWPG